MYVHPGVIAFLHGFARFAHASPAHLIGSPNPFVSPRTPKGADQAPKIPPQPAQCLKTVFSRFFCAKRGPMDAGRPEECFKKSFSKASRGSREAPGSRPAASQPPACVSSAGPPRCRCPAPASAGSPAPPCCGRSWSPRPPAAARRRTLKPLPAFVGARKAPASSTAFTRRSARSLLCWNLSALSCRTPNSVAGCFSTSSGAPCTVSWGARCRPRPPARSGRSTARPCAPPSWPGPRGHLPVRGGQGRRRGQGRNCRRQCAAVQLGGQLCGDSVVQGLDGGRVVAGRRSVYRQVRYLRIRRESQGQLPGVTCVPSVTSPLSRTSGMLPVTGPSNMFTAPRLLRPFGEVSL